MRYMDEDWCPENDGAYRAELAYRESLKRDQDMLNDIRFLLNQLQIREDFVDSEGVNRVAQKYGFQGYY